MLLSKPYEVTLNIVVRLEAMDQKQAEAIAWYAIVHNPGSVKDYTVIAKELG